MNHLLLLLRLLNLNKMMIQGYILGVIFSHHMICYYQVLVNVLLVDYVRCLDVEKDKEHQFYDLLLLCKLMMMKMMYDYVYYYVVAMLMVPYIGISVSYIDDMRHLKIMKRNYFGLYGTRS